MDLKQFNVPWGEHKSTFAPKMSWPRVDAFLEEKLYDIDEFIQSELGFEPLAALAPLTDAEANSLSSFMQTQELVNGRPNTPSKNI